MNCSKCLEYTKIQKNLKWHTIGAKHNFFVMSVVTTMIKYLKKKEQ